MDHANEYGHKLGSADFRYDNSAGERKLHDPGARNFRQDLTAPLPAP